MSTATQTRETAPVDRLAADFARWASAPYRADGTITGDRLFRVLRILGRPTYRLSELHTKAEHAAKLAGWCNADQYEARRQASRDAEKAVDDAYSAILRDVDILFTALTGVAADTAEALDLEIPLAQLAADARTLLAVA
ncbi:hypothetical protein ACWDBO_31380 [Streptomyces mirabilis]|uniref:hypothetical protein n=1 Tax=Streptomyces mirabilis TaxID=68239 RepID=UPI003329D7C8